MCLHPGIEDADWVVEEWIERVEGGAGVFLFALNAESSLRHVEESWIFLGERKTPVVTGATSHRCEIDLKQWHRWSQV